MTEHKPGSAAALGAGGAGGDRFRQTWRRSCPTLLAGEGRAAAYADLVERGAAHRMIGHVRSSQAFALNLFGPLDVQRTLAVLRLLVPDG